MNNFLMQMKIELEKAKKEEYETDIRILRLLNEITSNACPYFDNIENLEAEAIKQAADELFNAKNKALELKKKIQKIKKDLGE